MINKLNDELDTFLKEEEDIDNLLLFWKENDLLLKKSEKRKEGLKEKIKKYLKVRSWKSYKDEKSKISVSLSTRKKETIDKTQLKFMLTDAQLAQVTRTSSFERLDVVIPETRKRLKQYVKK